jgi:hypothetical protein
LLLWFESNGPHRHMRVALPESSPGGARRQLRARLVARRRNVPARERQRASLLVARNVDRALQLRSHWRIAVYAALPDELDTAPLIALAQERGCRLYLPRIDRRRASRAMQFVEMRGPLRRNRLGIAEPATAATIGARWLDVVFLPLVGSIGAACASELAVAIMIAHSHSGAGASPGTRRAWWASPMASSSSSTSRPRPMTCGWMRW